MNRAQKNGEPSLPVVCFYSVLKCIIMYVRAASGLERPWTTQLC